MSSQEQAKEFVMAVKKPCVSNNKLFSSTNHIIKIAIGGKNSSWAFLVAGMNEKWLQRNEGENNEADFRLQKLMSGPAYLYP